MARAGAERRVFQHPCQQVAVGRHAVDNVAVERRPRTRDGRCSVLTEGDQLAEHGVVERRKGVAIAVTEVVAQARPVRGRGAARCGPVEGRIVAEGVFGIQSALDGVPAQSDVLLPQRRVRPAAISIWCRTRSIPVTSSVTGCSTWKRAFISMNQKRPSSPTRNSQVPAFE